MMKKILFVEDDWVIGSIVTQGLQQAGYEVRYANTLVGFREALATGKPDLLLLDLEIDGRSSADELPFVRTHYPLLPILVASSHTAGQEIGDCLSAGISYYIKKPYEMEELLPLIHRFCPVEPAATIRFGQYRFTPDSRELTYQDRLLRVLNPKEAQLLHILLAHRGEVIDRAQLLQAIWHNEAAGDSLNNYITALRRYLKDDVSIQIQSVKRIGYCLSD